MEKTAQLGFDFLEISIDESEERLARLDWGPEQRRRLLNASLDAGVPISSMCLSAHRRCPLGSADPGLQAQAWEIAVKAAELACELGVRIVQLAAYDVYYEPPSEGVAELGEKYGLMMANEVMDTAFMNSISKHLACERRINSPWLRVYPDLGNLSAWGNDVRAELKAGAGSIVQVHLKDTLAVGADFPGKFRDVEFGQGCVDFETCLRTLEDEGYCGAYLIEMWHRPGSDDMDAITRAKGFIEGRFRAAVGERES